MPALRVVENTLVDFDLKCNLPREPIRLKALAWQQPSTGSGLK
jgi:hypothetical protein